VGGTEGKYKEGRQPTLRKGFVNVPGILCCQFPLDCLGMHPGEYRIEALWGERVLGAFPLRVVDQPGNPRLAERLLTAQAG
jgi:hypothetical protein